MRVAIEAASLALSSGGLARYTSELSLALARCFPDDEFFLISDQPFQMPSGGPPNLKRGGGPRNAMERRWWLWGIASEMRRLHADLVHGPAPQRRGRDADRGHHDAVPGDDEEPRLEVAQQVVREEARPYCRHRRVDDVEDVVDRGHRQVVLADGERRGRVRRQRGNPA